MLVYDMILTSEMKKNVLFVVNIDSYFVRLVEIGILLNNTKSYKPVFYFDRFYPKALQHIEVCQENNIEYVTEFKSIFQQKPSILPQDNAKSYNYVHRKFLVYIYGLFLVGLIYELLHYYKEFKAVNKILNKLKPSIVILGGDIIGYNTPTVIKSCKMKNVPTVIVPGWMAGSLEAVEGFIYNPNHDCKKLSNYIIAKLYPKWAYTHKGKKIVRLPGFQILIVKLFDLEPPLPWVLHSGYADVIAAESKAMVDYMVNEGLPKEKIVLTGSLVNDVLVQNAKEAKRLRVSLYKELGLRLNKPMILFALPPNQFYNYGRPECEFKTYDDLVKFWVQSLASLREYNAIVSLHPALDYEQMKYIEKWEVKISQKPLPELMPLCDIFVVSISTTIQWAIASGKPVLNYDMYKYRNGEYKTDKGVISVETKEDYLLYLKKLTTDKKFYNKIRREQEASMRYWGIGDGKSAKRLLRLFDSLTKE